MSAGPEATRGRLQPPVDPERDHVRGPEDAPVTLVEYGDFQCPACGGAHEAIREALASLEAHVRFVFRHFPIERSHPHARLAAEAVEAAGAQGLFWEMFDLLFQHRHPDRMERSELVAAAGELGLDVDRFERELEEGTHAGRVEEDVNSAVRSGVNGTPSFFIDGVRYDGTWERGELKRALEVAAIDARRNAPEGRISGRDRSGPELPLAGGASGRGVPEESGPASGAGGAVEDRAAASSMTECFRRLLAHLEWANERAFGAVREARDERAVELLAHVLASERVWIERIRSGDSQGLEIWPTSSLAACEERMRENLRALRALLETASEDDLRRPIRYENSSGTEYCTPLDEILLHVMLHGTYHRGQIARAVRESGSEPVNTDFITFARERPAG